MFDLIYNLLFNSNNKEDINKDIISSNYLNNISKQGIQYLNIKNKIKNMNAKNINLIENFESNISESLNQPNNFLQQELNELQELENKFNSILSEYSSEYKIYLSQIKDFINDETTQYAGKNVRDSAGGIYYINNFGEARHYSRDAWYKNAHPTCKKSSYDYVQLNYRINSSDSKFKIGEPMKSNQPCGFEGKNITYEQEQYQPYTWSSQDQEYFKENGTGIQQELTRCENAGNIFTKGQNQNYPGCNDAVCCKKVDNNSTLSYIDNNGNMRKYNSLNINDTNESCPKGIETISEEIYKAFPLGENMSADTLCALANVGNEQKQKLVNLNNQLLQLSEQIYNKIQTSQSKVNENNGLNSDMNMKLNTQLDSFKQNFQELTNIQNQFKTSSPTLNQMFKDKELINKSNNLKYIMWSVITFILIVFIYRYLRKRT